VFRTRSAAYIAILFFCLVVASSWPWHVVIQALQWRPPFLSASAASASTAVLSVPGGRGTPPGPTVHGEVTFGGSGKCSGASVLQENVC
jgi:hypothetical protein